MWRGSCVLTLKVAGLLPNRRVTKDGFARSIPIKKLDMKEGERAVLSTSGSKIGHVVYAEKKNGQYVSIVEGGVGQPSGRVIPASSIRGEIDMKKL